MDGQYGAKQLCSNMLICVHSTLGRLAPQWPFTPFDTNFGRSRYESLEDLRSYDFVAEGFSCERIMRRSARSGDFREECSL